MERLSVAVLGAGTIGRHHVRVLESFADVVLGWVVDPLTDAAGPTASLPAGCRHLESTADLPMDQVDLAFIATPTESHHDLAMQFIAEGIPIFVEKPLAHTREQAEALVEAAGKAGTLLAVGHIERFNPVVRFLSGMSLDPHFLQFERLSPFTPRISSNVVSDLMVHDLDLACVLAGESPSQVEASVVSVHSDEPDIAVSILTFPSGCVATCTASRATQDKVRRITVTGESTFLEADLLRQDVSVKRDTQVEFPSETPGTYRQATVVEIPYLERSGEPLQLQARDVVDAVRDGRQPTVTGEDGLRAVDLACRVEAAAGVDSD